MYTARLFRFDVAHSNELEADIEEYVLDKRRLDGFNLLTHEVTDVVAAKLVERDMP